MSPELLVEAPRRRNVDVETLPMIEQARRFGVRPTQYSGFIGGIRSFLSPEGRAVRKGLKDYENAPYTYLPLAETTGPAATRVKAMTAELRALNQRKDKLFARAREIGATEKRNRFEALHRKYETSFLTRDEEKELTALIPVMDEVTRIIKEDAEIIGRIFDINAPFIGHQEDIVREKFPELLDVDFRNNDQRYIPNTKKPMIFSYDVPELGAHSIALIPKGDKLYYYDPTGNSSLHRHGPGDTKLKEIKRFANGKKIIENTTRFQGEFGSCFSMATHAALDPVTHEERARKYKATQDLTGLTPEEITMIGIQQAADAKYLEKGYVPAPAYKKGGLVTVAKETYSKTPEDVGDYKLVKKTPTMLIYQKGNHYVVGVRGTQNLEDVKADVTIPFGIKNSSRFKKDEKTLREWKKSNPGTYTGVGHSLGGAILDELINDGLIESATSYNPAMGTETGKNKRIYAEHDPLRTIGKPDEIVKTKHSILGHAFPIGRAIESHSLNNFPDTEEMRHQITEVPLVEKRRLGGDKGMKKEMKSGGVVEKVKRVAKKVKEVAEHVGKEVVKEAKKHSHKLKDAGKAAGAALGTAGGAAAATAVGAPEAAGLASTVGSALGSKIGEFLGEKAHEGIQSLKKGGRVRKPRARPVKQADIDAAIKKEDDAHRKAERADKSLGVQNLKVVRERKLGKITDTAPMKHKATVEDKKKKPVFKEGGKVKKPSAWMAHVKAHHAKVGGSYKDAMKSAKATYKPST
jgi:hypothetical protein